MFWSKLFGGGKQKEIGKVVHYFDKIQVAVISLSSSLRVGDNLKFSDRGNEFTMAVESMQVDHQDVPVGKPGDEVAIKVAQPVKAGAKLFRA